MEWVVSLQGKGRGSRKMLMTSNGSIDFTLSKIGNALLDQKQALALQEHFKEGLVWRV